MTLYHSWQFMLSELAGTPSTSTVDESIVEIREALRVGKRPFDNTKVTFNIWPTWKRTLTDAIGECINLHPRQLARV